MRRIRQRKEKARTEAEQQAIDEAVYHAITQGGHKPVALAVLTGRKVIQWIRQSTRKQVQVNLGSRAEQLAQIKHLKPYNVSDRNPAYELFDAFHETAHRFRSDGSPMPEREQFERLLALLESGAYGVLLAYNLSRVARNFVDSFRFMDVLQRKRILLLIDGQLLDVQRPGDAQTVAGLLSASAIESAQRTKQSQETRLQVAEKGAYRCTTPTGLVYANPKDPEFMRQIGEAGLSHWISDAQLDQHDVVSEIDKRSVYILPFPNKQVFDACRLRISWLLETGDVKAVYRRIMKGHDGWPRPKEVPYIAQSRWRWDLKVEWLPVTPARLREWYTRPMLRGIYSYQAHGLAANDDVSASDKYEVVMSDAFPSFMDEEIGAEVDAILSARTTYVRSDALVERLRYKGVRVRPLPDIRCGLPHRGKLRRLPGTDGQPEERAPRLNCIVRRNGERVYATGSCSSSEAHTFALSAAFESVVLRMLLREISPDRFAAGFAQLTVNSLSTESEYAAACAEVTRLQTAYSQAYTDLRLARIASRSGRSADAGTVQSTPLPRERGRGGVPDVPARLSVETAAPEDRASMTMPDQYSAGAAESRYVRDLLDEVDGLGESLTAAEKARDALLQNANELSRVASEEKDRILALATDFHALIAAAVEADRHTDEELRATWASGDTTAHDLLREKDGQLRQLLTALGIVVYASPLDNGRVLVALEFPGGNSITEVADIQHVESAQAERVWLSQRVLLDAYTPEQAASDVSLRLNVLSASPGAQPQAITRSAADVRALVVQHMVAEHSHLVTVPATSVAAIAARVGASTDDVLCLALRGRLGCAAVGPNGEFHIEATDAQLARAFPSYALRAVAAAAEWPEADTVRLCNLQRETKVSHYKTRRGAILGAGIVYDAAGGAYTRRSAFDPHSETVIADALARAVSSEPAFAALSGGEWIPVSVAVARLGGVHEKTLMSQLPSVRFTVGGKYRRFVYLTPEAADTLRPLTLTEAVAALVKTSGLAYSVGDFATRQEVLASLKDRGFGVSRPTWISHRKRGFYLEIEAITEGEHRYRRQYVYFPAAVRTTTSRKLIEQWKHGGLCPPPVSDLERRD
jgi:DNA invertase Pin-like site-specific DNA recombinase